MTPSIRPIHAVLLAVCILVLALERLHTYDEPLESDITTYALIGHEALQGRWLYSDLWDNKSPLVYATYAAGELVAGYGPLSIFCLGLSAATIALVGIYAAVALAASATAAVWAAVAWTIISADQRLQANQPNIEVFLNAALIWLVVLLMQPRLRPVAVGLLAAIVSLYKLVTVPLVVCLYAARALATSRPERRRLGSRFTIAIITGASLWALVLLYFGATGRGRDFWTAVFTYNTSLAASPSATIARSVMPSVIVPRELWCAIPLIALSAIGVAWLIRTKRWQYALPWLAYALGAMVAVDLPGKFFAHYYQLWLPVYCVGSGIGLYAVDQFVGSRRQRAQSPAASASRPRQNMKRRANPSPHREASPPRGTLRWMHIAGGAMIIALLAFEVPYYGQSADAWSIAKYGTVFVDVKRFAPEVDHLLRPEETFFEWGDEAGFYYYTGRRPPSGILYAYPVIFIAPMRSQLEARLIADLEHAPPELVVVNTIYVYPTLQLLPIAQWLGKHYYLWEQGPTVGPFVLYIRQHGALEGRIPVDKR